MWPRFRWRCFDCLFQILLHFFFANGISVAIFAAPSACNLYRCSNFIIFMQPLRWVFLRNCLSPRDKSSSFDWSICWTCWALSTLMATIKIIAIFIFVRSSRFWSSSVIWSDPETNNLIYMNLCSENISIWNAKSSSEGAQDSDISNLSHRFYFMRSISNSCHQSRYIYRHI